MLAFYIMPFCDIIIIKKKFKKHFVAHLAFEFNLYTVVYLKAPSEVYWGPSLRITNIKTSVINTWRVAS